MNRLLPNPRGALAPLVLLLLAACAAPPPAAWRATGDPERAAVLAVLERSFEAIAAQGDQATALWREVLLDEGAMSSVRLVDGQPRIHVQSYAEHFQDLAGREDPRAFLERFWDPIVLVDGDIATVWTRYDFWLDDSFSHGGTDVVVLLRTEAGWKIASFAWSVERDPPPGPLPPPEGAAG